MIIFGQEKDKKTIKGLNIISLYYTDANKIGIPVNFRMVDKSSGKTKNDYFMEMLDEVLSLGLKPLWITGDSWYSRLDNLKSVKDHRLGFMLAIVE